MAEFDFLKLVYILLVTISTPDIVTGLRSYTEHHLEEAKICHPLGKKRETFVLPNEYNAAVIVKPMHTFDSWRPQTNKSCKFVFKAPKGEHLFAVIQNMSLRRHNETHCLDYIKFKRKDKHSTQEFCGQIDRRKVTFRPMQEQSMLEWEKGADSEIRRNFSEFDVEGEIETTIFISKTPLQPDETLDLTIVYTPYKGCGSIKSDREEYRSTKSNVCIWKEYFCDGFQNCVDEICRDEENCERGNDIVSSGTGTKVTIGAVTTMVLCFIIFVMGLWICRRNKKMCWSTDCAGPSPNDNRLSRGEREIAGSAHQSVAVDPMLEVAVLPSVLDKDLPPSYDSLFPEQSNPSAP